MNKLLQCLALSFAASIVAGDCTLPSGLSSTVTPVDNTGFVNCHGKLSLGGTNGLQIVGESGELVQLMGLSTHGLQWFPQCYTKESIAFLVENWGMNLFRAAMYVTETGYSDGSPEVKDLVKNIVQWTKELGIYVLIDWHILSPGDPNSASYTAAPAFFEEMAQLYAGEKHVIYEICNEPNGVSWTAIKSYADKIIPIIRKYDQDALIVVGTPSWSQEVDKPAATPVANPHNVMYTFHFYAGTHMYLKSLFLANVVKVPIFVTEWGTSEASGNGGPYLDNAVEFLSVFMQYNVPFSMWSYADKNEVSAALQENACSSSSWGATSCAGTFLRSYITANVETCASDPVLTPAPVAPIPSGEVSTCTEHDGRCSSAMPCCDSAQLCYSLTGTDMGMCMDSCGDPYACDILDASTSAPTTETCIERDAMCSGTLPCCDSAQLCYSLSGTDIGMCMDSCGAPFSCEILDASTTAPGTQSTCFETEAPCDATMACCDSAQKCYSLTSDIQGGMCMTTCSSPWICVVIGESTPVPTPTSTPTPATPTPTKAVTPTPTSTPTPATPTRVPTPAPTSSQAHGTCPMWSVCMADPTCCVTGTTCMRQSRYYSQCRADCPSSWDCAKGATPQPAVVPAACTGALVSAWGSCLSNHCCEYSYKCYEQSVYYAQCRPAGDCSLTGWTCKELNL